MTTKDPVQALSAEHYASLVTFRKNGTPMPTPVWFAEDASSGIFYVETTKNAGKVKRIRNRSEVTLAACNARGQVKGETLAGQAYIVTTPEELVRAEKALQKKYGLVRQILYFFMGVILFFSRKGTQDEDYIGIKIIPNEQ